MRLPRPYVPWSVREQVIDRQMKAAGFVPSWAATRSRSAERRVRWKIEEFFAGKAVELHHDPALVNRNRLFRSGNATKELPPGAFIDGWLFVGYLPDANDPCFLAYMVAGEGEEHDVRTRVRGPHGQHSDLGLARKRKRKERKAKRPKRRWPSRKFPKSRARQHSTRGRPRGSRAVRESGALSNQRGKL